MPLHPQSQALLDMMTAVPAPPIEELTVEMARQSLAALFANVGRVTPVAAVRDLAIPGAVGQPMRARAYTPPGQGPFPVLLFLHGGGWVAGDLESYDPLCRELTNASGCLLVAIEYRLAPEHKFPAAQLDSHAALSWIAEHAATLGGDPRRLAVGGDSAGGNLAAVVAQMARDRGGPALALQLLVYPVTNHDYSTGSYRDFADGYLLTRAGMVWNWNHYLPNEEAGRNPMASPLRASSLTGLAPAFIVTAEYDPLRDEGEAYAARLRDAGVPVELRRYDGMLHAFFSLGDYVDDGRRAVADAGAALRRAFAA